MFKLKNTEILKIVVTQVGDAERIINYCNRIGGETDYLSFGGGEFNKTIEEEKEAIDSFLDNSGKLHIYGEIDGEIVALLDVTSSPKPRISHSAEFGISVLKDHWGKGIGSLMIEYMIDWARRSQNIKKLNLKVLANNESAINLYRKFDFTMEGRISKEFYVNGIYVDMISMGYWIE